MDTDEQANSSYTTFVQGFAYQGYLRGQFDQACLWPKLTLHTTEKDNQARSHQDTVASRGAELPIVSPR